MTSTVQLRRVARFAYGDSLASESRVDGEYPVVGSGGVSGTHIKRNFRAPGIVIGRKGSYGSVHWIESGGFAIDTAYYIDERMTKAHLRWLYYVLQGIDLRGVSQDVGVPGLSRDAAYAVGVPSPPPLEEQRRIADFLDAETTHIDKLSDVTDRQVLTLGERLHESFREATTAGGNATVRTGIDWMPLISEDWNLNKVAHHFTVGGGTTPSSAALNYFGDGVYWVNSADIKNGIIESPSKSVTLEAIRDYPSLEIHPRGSLVIALYGQGGTKGRVGILGVEACLNQACCALNESGRVKAEYAFFWFRAHKEGVISLAVGAGQPNLSQDLIKSLWIPAPRVEEQLNIVDRLKSEEKHSARLIASLESRKRLLAERRQALITAAVTGEFDVSAASGRGIEE